MTASDVLAELRAAADPVERAQRASQLVTDLQATVAEASRIRREAMEELVFNGRTQTQLAQLLGMTRARVGQLLSSGPKAERIFLGSGPITVALGGKQEENKRGSGRVLAREDLNAFERLQGLARTLGLETSSEIVEPPGFINLNRDNLIVIVGPRLSPIIEQVLESDQHLRFERGQSGWFLRDRVTGEEYHSPMDTGEGSADFAYFGRLPRIDGRGSFLYIAGIHAIGAPGVIHFLENSLQELYSDVKTKRFSTIIRSEFDPKTLEVVASKRVTPIYRPEG